MGEPRGAGVEGRRRSRRARQANETSRRDKPIRRSYGNSGPRVPAAERRGAPRSAGTAPPSVRSRKRENAKTRKRENAKTRKLRVVPAARRRPDHTDERPRFHPVAARSTRAPIAGSPDPLTGCQGGPSPPMSVRREEQGILDGLGLTGV